jgi:two-component system cell cycle response regulator DivK
MARILVVEDNEMNLDMLSRRLQKRGHEVLVATDGLTGVNLAQSNSPNLILMDMSLPIMDGWEATRRIKASTDTHHIPVIALTAHALAEDRQKCFDAGCDDYESKPIKFPELLAKINAILGIRDEGE